MLTLIAIIKNFIHDGWDGDMWSDDTGIKTAFVIIASMLDIAAIVVIIMACIWFR